MLYIVIPYGSTVRLASVNSGHMVLQQKESNPVWGLDSLGTKTTLTFAGKSYYNEAENDCTWMAQPANKNSHTLCITGISKIEVQDILIGEV